MKNFFKYIVIIVVAMVVGCRSEPKVLESEQLERIITEAMITNAIIEKDKTNVDTLDPYLAILEKEGVTLQDVKYTIEQMAGRKSNPLDNMFTNIKANVDSIVAQVAYKYKKLARYDSIAMDFTLDTLFFSDSIIKGSPDKFKKVFLDLKEGTCELLFQYKSHAGYEISMPMVVVSKIVDSNKFADNEWMNRAYVEQDFKHIINISKSGCDSLKIGFSKSIKAKGKQNIKDTSYMKNITILYKPTINNARKRYFEYVTNIKLDTLYRYDYKTDSLLPRALRREDL